VARPAPRAVRCTRRTPRHEHPPHRLHRDLRLPDERLGHRADARQSRGDAGTSRSTGPRAPT
jgi:hypothetical protein